MKVGIVKCVLYIRFNRFYTFRFQPSFIHLCFSTVSYIQVSDSFTHLCFRQFHTFMFQHRFIHLGFSQFHTFMFQPVSYIQVSGSFIHLVPNIHSIHSWFKLVSDYLTLEILNCSSNPRKLIRTREKNLLKWFRPFTRYTQNNFFLFRKTIMHKDLLRSINVSLFWCIMLSYWLKKRGERFNWGFQSRKRLTISSKHNQKVIKN